MAKKVENTEGLKDKETYKVVATGTGKHMKQAGKVYEVCGAAAKRLIAKGAATLAMLFIMLLSLTANAQIAPQVMTGSGDTVVNTATEYVAITLKEAYSTVTFQVKLVELSGTTAGNITLQGSLDGVTFETVDSVLITSPGSGNSAVFATTDVATQANFWVVNGNPYYYYRISYTGSGTMSDRIYGYCFPQKAY